MMETMDTIPPVLLVRIESSILQDEQVQEILLPSKSLVEESGVGTASIAASSLGTGDNAGKVSTRLESTGPFPVHVFDPCTTGASVSEHSSHDWLWKGSTTSGKRLVIQTAKELKELGTKARARLEEEKMKRPEIQILDQIQTSDPEKNKTRKTTSFSNNISSQKGGVTTTTGIKRKLEGPSRKKPISKRKQPPTKSQSSPHWVPDVSHIKTPEKEQQSDTVKLHGIPIHCTTEHVKKFFAGLPVEKITILLPNDITIPSIDACNPHQVASDSIDIRLRVLVTFASASTAALASDRSGEAITIGGEQDQEETFAVAVTLLSKKLAHALSMVSIAAIPGTSFATTVDRLTTKLHPMVDKILWSVTTQRNLHGDNVPIDASIRQAQIVLPREEADALLAGSSTNTWLSNPLYMRFAKHYNKLVDMQDELIHQVPYPTIDTIRDSQNVAIRKGADPVVALTTKAYQALDAELNIIERLLYQARVYDQLGIE